jgi:diacylglycerol kinase family enzyme
MDALIAPDLIAPERYLRSMTRSDGDAPAVTEVEGLARSTRALAVQAALPVHHPAELPEILTRALEPAPDLLIFGGGDGSLTAAAARLAHRDTALGMLPLDLDGEVRGRTPVRITLLPQALRVLVPDGFVCG